MALSSHVSPCQYYRSIFYWCGGTASEVLQRWCSIGGVKALMETPPTSLTSLAPRCQPQSTCCFKSHWTELTLTNSSRRLERTCSSYKRTGFQRRANLPDAADKKAPAEVRQVHVSVEGKTPCWGF